MKNKGFTIVEILTVIGIMALVLSLGFASYTSLKRKVLAVNTGDELKSKLVKAQQLSVASAGSVSWGVHIEEDRYILFSGDTYSSTTPSNDETILEGATIKNSTSTISDGAGGFSQDIIFSQFFGQTSNTGTIQLILTDNSSTTYEVLVKQSGQIE